jgi:hypothetical protein
MNSSPCVSPLVVIGSHLNGIILRLDRVLARLSRVNRRHKGAGAVSGFGPWLTTRSDLRLRRLMPRYRHDLCDRHIHRDVGSHDAPIYFPATTTTTASYDLIFSNPPSNCRWPRSNGDRTGSRECGQLADIAGAVRCEPQEILSDRQPACYQHRIAGPTRSVLAFG